MSRSAELEAFAKNCAMALSTSIDDGSKAAAQLRLLRDGTGMSFHPVDIESFLARLPVATVRLLLEHLPTLAEAWRVTDMRDGEPTRLVRDGWQGQEIAMVRRHGQGKRGRPRWAAFVGSEMVSPPDRDESGEQMPIDWSDAESAQAACDAQLRASGVVLVEAAGSLVAESES